MLPHTAIANHTHPDALQVTCACDFIAVRSASQQVRTFLDRRGIGEADAAALELALVEAANNAVEHSPANAQSLSIKIDATIVGGAVELRITDRTPGFAWPKQANLPDNESESGRGLFLIQALVDRATYLRKNGDNCLVLTKAISDTPPRAPLPSPETLTAQMRELESALDGMTEELSSSYETLTSIFRYSSGLVASHDLDDFAKRLLHDLASLAEADLIVLRLLDASGKQLEVYRTEPPSAATALKPLATTESASLEAEAARTKKNVWFDNAQPLCAADPLSAGQILRGGVCHPLILNDQLFGTITLGRSSGESFRAAQVSVLHTLSEFLAIQISNERSNQERVRLQIMQRELDIAASIQRSLLPKELPRTAPFSIATCSESARDVGGDFFDIVPVSDHGVLLVIADVMGKGIPAALFAALLRSVVRSQPQHFTNPALLLNAVNRILYDDFSRVDMFATALIAFLDVRNGDLIAASAGHCPLLVAHSGESAWQTIAASGPPIGVEPGANYYSEIASLRRGGRALLYTDGITELSSPTGEMFGEARLTQWFGQRFLGGHPADPLKNQLLEELARFHRGQIARDDQTFILISNPDTES